MAIYAVEHKLDGLTGWRLKRRFTNQGDALEFHNKMLGQFSWNTYAKINRKYGGIIRYRVIKLIS